MKKEDIKKGDKVIFNRASTQEEDYSKWQNSWTSSMNRMIGKPVTVVSIDEARGSFQIQEEGFCWPIFLAELFDEVKVDEPEIGVRQLYIYDEMQFDSENDAKLYHYRRQLRNTTMEIEAAVRDKDFDTYKKHQKKHSIIMSRIEELLK